MNSTPTPTASTVCEMPKCLPIRSEGDGNIILAGAIALLLLALLLGISGRRK